MRGQLRLWSFPVKLAEKLKAEKEAEAQVFYHFCGNPLPMYARNTRAAW